MKYEISELQLKMREYGIDSITLGKENYENASYLRAMQYVKANDANSYKIEHCIRAYTYTDGIKELIKRAEIFHNTIKKEIATPIMPNTGERNMVGHINDGNFEPLKDIL